MQAQQPISRTPLMVFFIMAIAAWRVLTSYAEHYSSFFGFTPVFALALFGAAYFKGRYMAFILSLMGLFISDIVLCFTVYAGFREGLLYPGWYWVYASFVFITLAGKLILTKISIVNVLLAVVMATALHWLVASAAECVHVRSVEGFFSLYVQRLLTAASHEVNILFGTLIYSAVMFGGFEWMQRKAERPRFDRKTTLTTRS